MMGDAFKDRERALEEQWANAEQDKLVEKMREKARLEEITSALATTLQVEHPDLLARVVGLGVTMDTGPALLLAPLVQIAWAEGKVTDDERATVLRLAHGRGLAESSPAYAQLGQWLDERPSDELFDVAIEVIQTAFTGLTAAERDERIATFAKACHEVASASGGGLARLFGLSDGVSSEESEILDRIKANLRGPA
jgi:hypothetical protein